MRTPIIAGNWKMNTNVNEAVELVRNMKNRIEGISGVETLICPPFVSLASISELISGSPVALGAQNMHFEEKGAYTGEVSPSMIASLCSYVILGHSERREYFGETDGIVNRKIKAAFHVGLKPIVCVGENADEKDCGKTAEVVSRQVRGALGGLESLDGMVVAYEPIWCIGTGKASTGEEANQTVALIRQLITTLFTKQIAEGIRIQYGGSVTAANITEFMSQPEIDGALVGGASLKPDEFISIVEQSAKAKDS